MEKFRVFYDGSCYLCSTEMGHYRRMDKAGQIEFIDVAATGFRPEEYGRTLDEFMGAMHVMDAEGRFHAGVDAFPLIWRAVAPYSRLYAAMAGLISTPGTGQLARLGYKAFAKLRLYLPKRKGECPDGICALRR
ncbi:MAG TPA: DUF393 domain-containing protein [Nitrospirota bacterium]|jgi:predicted DCC family thiol-disulfide oxidoreductase YuxK